MRLVALLILLSFSLSSYCAAAHAFGALPMQTAKQSVTMADMPGCAGMMQQGGTDKTGGHHPAKTDRMNCKSCCASLISLPATPMKHQTITGNISFPLVNRSALNDLRFRIFHPPKFSA